MNKELEILDELKKLSSILSRVIGSSEMPESKRFSKAALDKAAKEFKKLETQRGEWVNNEGIRKYIKNAPYYAARFIVEELKFKNYYKRGHEYYLSKSDLIKLAKELKDRDVNLSRYVQLKEDKKKFDQYLEKVVVNPSKLPYELPNDMVDISTSKPPAPLLPQIREHIKQLKKEFEEFEYGGNFTVIDPLVSFFTDPLVSLQTDPLVSE